MKKISLGWQIFLGLLLGIIFGTIFHNNQTFISYIKPFGEIFLHLIKMIVIPIVISSLIVGIAGIGDAKKLGKLGAKTILYFEIVTTIALIIGLIAANVVQPGKNIDTNNLKKANITQIIKTTHELKEKGFIETLVNIVPSNIFKSIAEGEMLAIIFFSVIFGLALAKIKEKGKPLIEIFEGIASAMFEITNQIMKFAPIGVFSFMGVTVARFGLNSLIPLSKLVILVYLTMFFFVVVVLGIVAKISGTNLFQILLILKDDLILAFTTASSETVLPDIMEKMEKFGCPKAITSFVIPTGYSFNLDGSTLYQAITVIFITQLYGMQLSFAHQLTLLLTLMVTSKGIAGVPGGSFIVISTTLGSMGLPLEGIAFITGVERIMDMARTTVNVIGNSLAAVVMSKWEKQYNVKKAKIYIKEVKSLRGIKN